jgi:hypothetical protein
MKHLPPNPSIPGQWEFGFTLGMTDEFSVWIFFPDGSHVDEVRWVDAETAVRLAKEITERPAAEIGLIERVIITDGGDNTCFEWKHGQGVTFP